MNQSIEEQFQKLHIDLIEHRLPVIDRPKAVLELWRLYDKMKQETKKDTTCQ